MQLRDDVQLVEIATCDHAPVYLAVTSNDVESMAS